MVERAEASSLLSFMLHYKLELAKTPPYKETEEKPFESKLRSKTKIHRNGRSHLVSATKQPQKSAKINEKKTKTHSSRFTFNSTETQH